MLLSRKEIHLFVGASGSGKSTLLLQCVAGGMPFGFPLPVAYVGTDRGDIDHRARIERLSLTPKEIELYSLMDDLSFDLERKPAPSGVLAHCLKALERPFATLVLDPIGIFMEGSVNDYHSVLHSLGRLGRLAIKRNICLIGVHHTSKARTDFTFHRAQDRVLGSHAFAGYSSTQIVLVQGKEQEVDHDTLTIVAHNAPEEIHHLVRDSRGFFAVQETATASTLRLMPDTFTSADWVGEMERGGASRSTANRELQRLRFSGRVRQVGRGRYAMVAGT